MAESSLKPNTKVQNGINWGAAATLIVTMIAVFSPEVYTKLPAGFELSLGLFMGSLVSSLAAWWKAA